VVRNAVLGAGASFILWATYDTNAAFVAEAITPRQVAMSLLVGGGGSWIIDRLVRKTQQAAIAEENTTRVAEAFREYLDEAEEGAEDEQVSTEAERQANQEYPQ
jgi:hypothetical protein